MHLKNSIILLIIYVIVVLPGTLAQTAQTKTFSIDATIPSAKPETGYLQMGGIDAGKSPDGNQLSVNSIYLMLDNKPWLPVMGEFHFSRYPEKYWEDEILKMKAGGIQIISTYVFWIHHEEVEGQFDWTGQRNLRKFVELCAKHGLYVFPRIGPWAHGEVRNGGFPDWLLEKSKTRVNDPTYLSFVQTFYNEIGKQLKGLLWKDGGPVIGIQIENEYSNRSENGGAAYIAKLKKMAIEAGLDVPLYTVTGWDNAVIPPHIVIPVFGGYPDEPWSGSIKELAPDPEGVYQFHVATPTGKAGIMQGYSTKSKNVELSHYPKFTAELGGGMEDTYHRRVVISGDDIASMSLTALGSGVNLLGYYMFHGGTNPEGKLTTLEESHETGYPNDVPVKSYDFQAPLGEFGQMNDSFRKLKIIHQFISDFGTDLAVMPAFQPDIVPSNRRDTLTLRIAARVNGNKGFVFFNNYLRNYPLPEQKGIQVNLKLQSQIITLPAKPIDIPSQSYFFWPVNMDLNGVLLKYATAQPFAKIEEKGTSYYFFTAIPGIKAEFAIVQSTIRSINSNTGDISYINNQAYINEVEPSTKVAINILTNEGKPVRIILLSQEQSYNAWKIPVNGKDHLLITQADVFTDGNTIDLRSRDPKAFSFSILPAVEEGFVSSSSLRKDGTDGAFDHYTISVEPKKIDVELEQIQKAGPTAPVKMGPFVNWRNGSVAIAPDESAFENAGAWRIKLPDNALSDVSNVFLNIDYQGDVARLYEGNNFLDDNFFNGKIWEVGLKRFMQDSLTNGLELKILPLRKDAPIYIPKSSLPDFGGHEDIAGIKTITASPEYEVKLNVQDNSSTQSSKFILGADISALDAPRQSRWRRRVPLAYQENGKKSDELTILLNHGWKAFRLRVFISPVQKAPDNSLENTIPLAKRIKEAGAIFLLDFHYSDTWADPQHQNIPAVWQGLSFDSLESRVEEYSANVIRQLKDAGAMPDWVQIGNEITRGTLWPMAQVQIPGSNQYNPPEPYDENVQWDHLTRILKAGIGGVLSAAGNTPPRIAIHIDQGANWTVTKWFFDHLEAAHVKYDIIAQSFYPPWHHGKLEGLLNNMNQCVQRYNKDFLVAETGYDSSRIKNNDDMLWPITPQGRLQFMVDLVNTVKSSSHGLGVMYWAPERALWNQDGSPGPAVFVLDSLETLRNSPESHAPPEIRH